MNKTEAIDLAIKALNSYRGDNYQRAQNQFSNLTYKQKNESLYGLSGRTPQQILDAYKKHEDDINHSINILKALK